VLKAKFNQNPYSGLWDGTCCQASVHDAHKKSDQPLNEQPGL
jgi:hypothetical protein